MNNKNKLVIASRKSILALTQTEIIKTQLQQLYPHLEIEILSMSTEGDRLLGTPLAAIGGKGLFVKELEKVILTQEADFAVHSSKDMPAQLPDGLCISTFYERHDPRDAFVSNSFKNLDELPEGAIVGTASLRRQCLLKSLRPDLTIKVLRGNVHTRLAKLDAGEFDAIVLAAAGLERLRLTERAQSYFDTETFTPAVNQGTLCIECRADDKDLHALLEPLNHPETAICAIAERTMNQALQGGCQVPIGAYAKLNNNQLYLQGLVGSPDGSKVLRAKSFGPIEEPEALGNEIATQLIHQGAKNILAEVYKDHG